MTDNTDQIASAPALRISIGSPPVSEECRVVVERPVTVSVEGVGDYTLMCTPSDAAALAVGFVYTEGLISDMSGITSIRRCGDDPYTIRVRLSEECRRAEPRARNLIVASSCGMCGIDRIQEIIEELPTRAQNLIVPLSTILAAHTAMKSRQTLFRETGGAHAAAIFTSDAEILAFGEDIGRHNALDKAIGTCLLARRQPAGSGLAFSGRASFEIVAKAARAGIELIAAVSAPSSLAIEAARRCGITLCGFVRDDRATIYCHESRVRI
jgi:FdhD protein